ncbi:MAG: hypothetical protein AABX17_03450 [Nanoarchaeota archaeon]
MTEDLAFKLISSKVIRGIKVVNDYSASTSEARVRLFDNKGAMVHEEIALGVSENYARGAAA